MTETIRIRRFVARPVIVPMNLPLQTSTGAVARAPLVLIDCETDQGCGATPICSRSRRPP